MKRRDEDNFSARGRRQDEGEAGARVDLKFDVFMVWCGMVLEFLVLEF